MASLIHVLFLKLHSRLVFMLIYCGQKSLYSFWKKEIMFVYRWILVAELSREMCQRITCLLWDFLLVLRFPPSVSFRRCSVVSHVSSRERTLGSWAVAVPHRRCLKIEHVYSLEYTEIPKVFFTPHHGRRQQIACFITATQRNCVDVYHSCSKGKKPVLSNAIVTIV
jgi:hypothetical protein